MGLCAAGAVADDSAVVEYLDVERVEVVAWSMGEGAGEVEACQDPREREDDDSELHCVEEGEKMGR
jgi:hypothetical protein